MTSQLIDDSVWIPGVQPSGASQVFSVDGAPHVRGTLSAATEIALPPIRQGHTAEGLIVLNVGPDSSGSFTLSLRVPAADAVTLWRPGSTAPHGSIPPSWGDALRASPLDGMAVVNLVATDDRSILTVGADRGPHPLHMRAGIVEESGDMLVSFEWDGIDGQSMTVILDAGGRTFADSTGAVTRLLWGAVEPVPSINELPVYCTWYAVHLDVTERTLLPQLHEAAKYGFGTVIVDDGWQTRETGRGYGTAGDWRPEAGAFPDPRAFVRSVEQLGMRTMWWVGTPFIGYRSEAYQLDKAAIVADEPDLETAVLDPRSPAARAHLVGRLLRLLETTGAHGLKIDFLERFARDHDQAPPADADGASVEVSALQLLRELTEQAAAIRPELMLEFREPYIGPAAARYATMLRVSDCPLSPLQNRLGIVDLRLTSPGVSIHSDPVMWGDQDSPERVAQHLINTLFGVPQVSVDLVALSDSQRRVLGFWIEFWKENANTLLHGSFRPERPDLGYPIVRAADNRVHVIGRYAPVTVEVPQGDWRIVHIANADASGVVLRGTDTLDSVELTVRDAEGRLIDSVLLDGSATLLDVEVPTGGLLTLSRRPVRLKVYAR
ncbi:alpha-galactosidase [Leifsonia sp. EB41]|uniref:glycoside hydrolase family 36 protein n=1 Tax=Leifsonia sp. EB41 TaxID=3156260 RepID=UPI003511EED4